MQNFRLFSVVILSLAAAATASAQQIANRITESTSKIVRDVGDVGDVDEVNPCSTLGDNPKVGDCWSCFQSLLDDCDKNNGNADRRKACYDGANNFFTWCLGKVPSGKTPHRGASSVENMNLREGYSYTISFNGIVDAANIEVYVRDVQNGEVRVQQVNAFVFDSGNGFDVFFDNNNLGIENDHTVGIVTVARNPLTGNVDGAYASAVSVIEPLDLNKDGMVDVFDLTEAWNQYASGVMAFNDFVSFSENYNSR